MNPRTKLEQAGGGWRPALIRFAWLAVLTLVFANPGHGYAWYSGTSMASDGGMLGWGFTDASAYMYIHTAYVTTTLRSPNGRVASSGRVGAFNTVQSNVYLLWDANDLGNYTVSSNHEFYCIYMGLAYLGASSAFITVGLSAVCYNNPILLYPVKPLGWYRYTLKGPCPVACVTATRDINVGEGLLPPFEEVVGVPWTKIGTFYWCANPTPSLPTVGCTCWQFSN